MKRLFFYKLNIEILAWFFVVFILILPILYVIFFCTDKSFWDNMFGNLLATSLALIVGVPIGLWVDRYIKSIDNQRNEKFKILKEIEILELIKNEINSSLNEVFIPERKGNTKYLQSKSYKTNLWDSISASDLLKYIDSPSILDQITSAYYIIKLTSKIEESAYMASRAATVEFTNSDGATQTSAQMFIEDVRRFDIDFEKRVSEALKSIQERVIKLNNLLTTLN